ncbi:probable F-box protein At4g22030 [Beta vulgaris subsp. vulgaris]|uniref:probable F-box protein At4g22030 n=1 Tax=Beta vulgaris subsp. vulgaris TaxID=3555 RepID=UPI0025497947|nr:probable F-box protein At4g22030 [Beta vulgaris subsp. vulgaris]
MVTLQLPTKSSLSYSNKFIITKNAINVPKYLKYPKISVPKVPNQAQKQLLIKELNNKLTNLPLLSRESKPITPTKNVQNQTTIKLYYAILEEISDRIEMHQNICNQRENWNSLLLNSVNMITLTAVTMAGLAEASGPHGLGLRVSSTLLFVAGTGILLIMNKIQPSQLVEEQRNAVRLFKKLQRKIETGLAVRTPVQKDVEEAVAEVVALDRAYPLPLLGAMLDKFPKTLEPAVWWPSKKQQTVSSSSVDNNTCFYNNNKGDNEQNNGWSKELEEDMREIVGVTKRKDVVDYVHLGNKALKFNKMLAVSGPLLTGVAAVGAAFGGPVAGVVAAVAGSMAAAVNTIEHGGQVGMVFEMYRNCGGFFKLLEETVESTLEEGDLGKRENGEVFEMKMALHLGRSLSELRDLADKSRRNGGCVDEFASKLF